MELNRKKESRLQKMPFRRLKTLRLKMERLMLLLRKLRMLLPRELRRLRRLLVKLEKTERKMARKTAKMAKKRRKKEANCDRVQFSTFNSMYLSLCIGKISPNKLT